MTFHNTTCFLGFPTQSHAESFGHYFKKSVLDPKPAKVNQNLFNAFLRKCCFWHPDIVFDSFNALLSFVAEK